MQEAQYEALVAALEEARSRGLTGPGPVEGQVEHALGFAAASRPPEGLCVDLGTGGGVPGLVLASEWPATHWLLVDSRARSAGWAAQAVQRLGLEGRVTVVEGRAEEVGRRSQYRGAAAVVVARGFGPPAVTAECGAAFLEVGGSLVVSEPPGSEGSRWSAEALGRLGLAFAEVRRVPAGGFAVLHQVTACPPGFPRRVGIPAKRPLW